MQPIHNIYKINPNSKQVTHDSRFTTQGRHILKNHPLLPVSQSLRLLVP